MTKVTKASLEPPKIKWLIEPTYDDDGVQRTAGLDHAGREHGDPVPYAVSVGFTPTADTLHETLRRLVRDELFREAVAREEFESFEDAEDFDVEDDMFPVDPHTPYEAVFDPPPPGGGSSATLASDAPNGKGGPREPPTQPSVSLEPSSRPAHQTASGDSLPVSSPEKKVEKQIGVSEVAESSSYTGLQGRVGASRGVTS